MNEKYVNQYDGFFHEDKVLGYTSTKSILHQSKK